mmetsp:Transcript_10352/g.34259  ORF Transcript_10352/g.34259 Transcript_10352/m.34259 type:complete len:351 (-) Transcript_10352:281-1333(-)
MARTAAPKCDAWGFYLDELKWAALPQSRRWLDSLEAADEQRDAKWTKMTSRKGLDGMCQNARLRSTLKRRIRKGVPRSWRRAVWPKLIGLSVKPGALAGLPVSELQDEALKSGKTYAKLCAATAGEPPPDSINEIIERDLCRTFPRHALFDSRVDDAGRRSVRESEKQGVTQMRRLLRAYAEYDSALGYCQGMNYVASVLIIHVCGMQVSVQGSANDSIGSLRSPQAQKMQPGDGGDFSFLDASSEEATFWLFVTLAVDAGYDRGAQGFVRSRGPAVETRFQGVCAHVARGRGAVDVRDALGGDALLSAVPVRVGDARLGRLFRRGLEGRLPRRRRHHLGVLERTAPHGL